MDGRPNPLLETIIDIQETVVAAWRSGSVVGLD